MPPTRLLRSVAAVAIVGGVTACGTYVPSLRTWPDDNPSGEGDMVTSIIDAVRCELSYTVTGIINRDQFDQTQRKYPIAYTSFLQDWGVQVAINLTITERSSINPTVLLTPPGIPEYMFKFAGGLSASSEAQRLQKTNIFYFVSDLYNVQYFTEPQPDGTRKFVGREKCLTPTGDRYGSPLVNSDLRLASLLNSRLAATALGFASSPGEKPLAEGEKNVLSQTVSFKIETAGTATPSWTLVRAAVNPAGSFFSTGRDNMQELVITFGPLDKSVKGRRALNELAQATHIATQLQTGIQSFVTPFR